MMAKYKRDLHRQTIERILSAHGRGRPDKHSSISVTGKMKNPRMTTVRIDAFGVSHMPRVADTAKLRN